MIFVSLFFTLTITAASLVAVVATPPPVAPRVPNEWSYVGTPTISPLPSHIPPPTPTFLADSYFASPNITIQNFTTPATNAYWGWTKGTEYSLICDPSRQKELNYSESMALCPQLSRSRAPTAAERFLFNDIDPENGGWGLGIFYAGDHSFTSITNLAPADHSVWIGAASASMTSTDYIALSGRLGGMHVSRASTAVPGFEMPWGTTQPDQAGAEIVAAIMMTATPSLNDIVLATKNPCTLCMRSPCQLLVDCSRGVIGNQPSNAISVSGYWPNCRCVCNRTGVAGTGGSTGRQRYVGRRCRSATATVSHTISVTATGSRTSPVPTFTLTLSPSLSTSLATASATWTTPRRSASRGSRSPTLTWTNTTRHSSTLTISSTRTHPTRSLTPTGPSSTHSMSTSVSHTLSVSRALTVSAATIPRPLIVLPTLPAVAQQAQKMAAAVGSVGVVSTVAVMISTSGAFSRIAQCVDNDDDDNDDDDATLSPLVHPLRFAAGSASPSDGGSSSRLSPYLRGAVIGNIIIIPACTALFFGALLPFMMLLFVVWLRRRAFTALRRYLIDVSPEGLSEEAAAILDAREGASLSVRMLAMVVVCPSSVTRDGNAPIQNGDPTTSGGAADNDTTDADDRDWAQGMLRELRIEMGWPSVLVLPQVALAEGTAMAITRLFVLTSEEGAAAVIPALGGLAAVVLAVAWWVRALLCVVPSRDMHLKPASRLGVIIQSLFRRFWPRRQLQALRRLLWPSSSSSLMTQKQRRTKETREDLTTTGAADSVGLEDGEGDALHDDDDAASDDLLLEGIGEEQSWRWVLLTSAFEFHVRAKRVEENMIKSTNTTGESDDPTTLAGSSVHNINIYNDDVELLAMPLVAANNNIGNGNVSDDENDGRSSAAVAVLPQPSQPHKGKNNDDDCDVDNDRKTDWVLDRIEREARYDHFIGGKALRWAELAGLLCALGVGVAEGMPSSDAWCEGRAVIAFVLIIVQGLVAMSTMMPFENIAIGALSWTSFIAAGIGLMNVLGVAKTDNKLLENTATVVGVLGLVAIAVALVRPIVTARRLLRMAHARIEIEVAAASAAVQRPDDHHHNTNDDDVNEDFYSMYKPQHHQHYFRRGYDVDARRRDQLKAAQEKFIQQRQRVGQEQAEDLRISDSDDNIINGSGGRGGATEQGHDDRHAAEVEEVVIGGEEEVESGEGHHDDHQGVRSRRHSCWLPAQEGETSSASDDDDDIAAMTQAILAALEAEEDDEDADKANRGSSLDLQTILDQYLL